MVTIQFLASSQWLVALSSYHTHLFMPVVRAAIALFFIQYIVANSGNLSVLATIDPDQQEKALHSIK